MLTTTTFEKRQGAVIFASATTYRMCARCVMDTSDPEILFDDEGVCNHCRHYDYAVSVSVFRGEAGQRRLEETVRVIKAQGRGQRYDCLIGLSGGVDSTYTAYLVKKLGLRPLAVHLDNGWNSEIAVRNIENIVKKLGFDLHTVVLEWDEFRSLQLAFLRASTPDSEVPTDHAIVATLYQVARKNRIGWILDGGNIVTEMMIPPTWSHGHADWKYIRTLNRLFGGKPLRAFPHYTFFDSTVRIPRIDGIRTFPILNCVDYDKSAAMETLRRELAWQYYGGKHYESIYTRFYQGYILKQKFGFDKRRAHLSCLINDGRLNRAQALAELQKPAIDPGQLREDREFVIKKLGISETEFCEIMSAARKTFWDYPSYERDQSAGFGWNEVSFVIAAARSADRIMRLPRHAATAAHRAAGIVRAIVRVPRAALARLWRQMRSSQR